MVTPETSVLGSQMAVKLEVTNLTLNFGSQYRIYGLWKGGDMIVGNTGRGRHYAGILL